jgi:hypothetical protein
MIASVLRWIRPDAHPRAEPIPIGVHRQRGPYCLSTDHHCRPLSSLSSEHPAAAHDSRLPHAAALNAPSTDPRQLSAARNIEPRVTRVGSAPMTVRSATLLHPASSSVRLAHLQGFREWITRRFRPRAALHRLVQRRASQA